MTQPQSSEMFQLPHPEVAEQDAIHRAELEKADANFEDTLFRQPDLFGSETELPLFGLDDEDDEEIVSDALEGQRAAYERARMFFQQNALKIIENAEADMAHDRGQANK